MSQGIIKSGNNNPATTDVIEVFNHVLLQMDDYRTELVELQDWDALTRGLVNLNNFKNNLLALIQSIEADIYNLLPDKKVVIEGVGVVEKRRTNSKKWDSEGLLNNIVRSKLDNGTGEITPTDVFNLVETLKRVLPITPSLGWRSTELKKENIDTDDYCDITWGRPSVTIQSSKGAK